MLGFYTWIDVGNPLFEQDFPKLFDIDSKKTSESTPQYNCIAWAFGDNTKWWWPSKRAFWPVSFDGLTCMEAFQKYLNSSGWSKTDNFLVERGIEKIAIFANILASPDPTHAARLLQNGKWSSKLGQEIDISHGIHELDGPKYGSVIAVYRRKAD